jgi:hypothetical protein
MINLTHLSTEKVQAFRQRQANNGRQHNSENQGGRPDIDYTRENACNR